MRTGQVGPVRLCAFGILVPLLWTPSLLLAQDPPVTSVVIEGTEARAPGAMRINPDPVLQLGGANADPDEAFTEVAGAMATAAGGVLVVDRITADLRIFDATGSLVARAGRRGEGPGEFQQPTLLNAAPGDSVVVYDGMLRRMTIVAQDGSGFRSVSAQAAGPGRALAALDAHVLMMTPGGLPPRGAEGPVSLPMVVRHVDLDQPGAGTTIATHTHVQVAVSLGPLPTFVDAPFAVYPSVAASPAGFHVLEVDDPTIREYSWDGALRRTLRILDPAVPLSRQDFDEAIDRIVDQLLEGRDLPRDAVRAAFASLDRPATLPPFRCLLVDDLGWLWAEVHAMETDGPSTWIAIDSDGRAQGSVVMPEGLAVTHIGADRIVGVHTDALGVPHVRVHRIEGRP